jgi:hypothetical protein
MALSGGISAYFVYAILTFGIAKAMGHTELRGGFGALIAFGEYVVTMLAVLATNDWLANRYPTGSVRAPERSEPERQPVDHG